MTKLLVVLLFLFVSATSFAQTTLDKAKSLYENNRPAEAETILKLISKSHPDYGSAQYYLGRINCDRKNYDDAAEYFEEATKASPKTADYFNWLGDAYGFIAQNSNLFKQGLLAPKMKKAWETAVSLDPKNISARASLVQFYLQAPGFMGGSIDKAKATAKQVMDVKPAEGHRQLGLIFQYEKKYKEAEQEYVQMTMVDPAYNSQLVNYYLGQKEYVKAFDFLDRLVKKNPQDYGAVYQIGKTAAISGQNLDLGETCLKKYLAYTPQKNEPTHPGANMRLGQIKEKAGNKLEAKKFFETALKQDPSLKEAKEGLERCSK